MKQFFWRAVFFIFIISGCENKTSISELKKYAATEKYPEDKFLEKVINKKALVIGAHEDDDVIMAGTISILKEEGWEIKRMVFRNEDPQCTKRIAEISVIINDGVEFIEIQRFEYRNDLDSVEYAYMPIPKKSFDKVFNKLKVVSELVDKINKFNPTVIFTLDNELGGYGHPEHIFISQLILDLSEDKIIHPQKIYQGVYTNHMEKEIIEVRLTKLVKKWGFPSPYMEAIKMYNLPNGMPEPTVEINIQDQSANKMRYLKGFSKKEQQTIGKFMPHYDEFTADEYFQVFNREFFRVIDIN